MRLTSSDPSSWWLVVAWVGVPAVLAALFALTSNVHVIWGEPTATNIECSSRYDVRIEPEDDGAGVRVHCMEISAGGL